MTEGLDGNRGASPEDQKKSKVFFDRGRSVAGTGNYDYAIDMFIDGLKLDPDSVDAHSELRDISMKRKAAGGKAMGFFESMSLKRPTKDDKLNMLNAERLLAHDPGNTDHMVSIVQNAHRAGFVRTVMWMGPILQKANADAKRPNYNKFIVLRDIYKSLKEWRLAADATQYAVQLRPLDMDLATELKNLGAMETMNKGHYDQGVAFGESILDAKRQELLLKADQDIPDADAQVLIIRDAEQQYKAEPNDPGKLMRLIDALEKSESHENENRAIDVLQEWFDKTRQFRYRQRIGMIKMKQMSRMERSERKALAASPDDAERKKLYLSFLKEKDEFELKEYQLAADAYPTDNRLRFEVGVRLFRLGRFSDAIPVFQQARNDPKYRTEAGVYLGRCFLNAGFLDEADETLAGLIKDYALLGDDVSKTMYYWRGVALEQKDMPNEALSHYSKVAQWDFNYKDVQARIKKLRSAGATKE